MILNEEYNGIYTIIQYQIMGEFCYEQKEEKTEVQFTPHELKC